VVRELGRLRSSLRNLSVLVGLTLVSNLGIMLIKQKTLGDIFEIIRPIGVFPVGSSAIPGSEPSFVSRIRSFGPIPEASSEGFLDSFTPGGDAGKSSILTLRLFSEEFCNGVIQIRSAAGETPAGPGITDDHGHQIIGVDSLPREETSPCSIVLGRGFYPQSRWEAPQASSLIRRLRSGLPRGPLCRDLMTTSTPHEVYWDLRTQLMRPFEKGRNTKIQRYERGA
jgi:hypothetical protein